MQRVLCLLLVIIGGALANEEGEKTDYSWSSSNVGYAIAISIGAGLATGLGGCVAFLPSVLERVSPGMVLSVALSISAGVMLYVSFIEIFVKAQESILKDNDDEARAAALTTFFFFLGMFCCYLLELVVHRLDGSHDKKLAGKDATAAASSTSDAKEVDVELAGENMAGAGGGAAAPTAAEFFSTMDGTGHDHRHGTAAAAVSLQDPKARSELGKMGMLTGVAIALHNFPEGLATFLATVSDTSVGAALGTAIAIHNIPEGVCVAMPIYCARHIEPGARDSPAPRHC